MRTSSVAKRLLLIVLPLGLAAFQGFVTFLATKPQLKFIGSYHLDKIPHLFGGVFLAVLLELQVRRPRLWQLLAFAAAVTAAWEGYEFFFDPDTAYFYSRFPHLWRLDTAGDIAAAYLGAFGYWALFRYRD